MRKDRLLIRIGLFCVTVPLVLLISTSAFAYTLSPGFCLTFCHSIHPESNEAWENSTHPKANCISCHVKPGFLNLIKDHTALVIRVGLATLTDNYEKPVNKNSHLADEMWNESCEICHSLRKVTPSPTYRINHKVHLKKGVKCTQCHNRVGHPDVDAYKDFMKMEACFRCHGQEKKAKAPGGCSACHTDYPKPDNHSGATFYPKGHAKMAKDDRKYCSMCHLEKFCIDCHGMKVPHTKTFINKEHGKLVKQKGFTLCQRCHPDQQQFCFVNCHHKGWDPAKGPWWSKTPGLSQHPDAVRKQGSTKCLTCHDVTYCEYCHVRGLKPDSIKGPGE